MLPIPSLVGAWPGGTVLTLLVAAAPALFTWWTDRRLLARHDDPALPELLASRRRATVRVLAAALALLFVFATSNAAWAVPLLMVLLIAAGYPVRTRLLGETWRFGSYLWHSVLSIVGGFGFWIVLAYAPIIVQQLIAALGTNRLPSIIALSVALAAVLFAWEAWYPRIWLRVHAATPLDDATLTPRFDEIVRRAGTIVPSVFRVGPKGSRFVNAVALPSTRRPSVAMGSALLELLDADEATAIFAHEVAHFDHFTPRRLRRAQLINRLLIVTGVALPIIVAMSGMGWAAWIGWVWPVVVLSALLQRAAKSQQHETESDLRAAALCGDPEALVRGLVKLHLHARIPRRYAVDVERVASHPSLVRRIQAIRAGGAAAVEQLGTATVLRSTREGSWIVLDDTRSFWLDGVPDGTSPELATLRDAASSYRAVNYADLVELRVSANAEARSLTARTRSGDVWTVPIATDDVARVQRALDVVDLRLGKAGPAPSAGMAKVIPIVAAVVAIVAGQAGIVLLPIALAMWKPAAASLAALGAMSVVRAMLGAWQGSTWFNEDVVAIGLVGLAAVGIGALYLAYRLVKSGEQRAHFRLTMGVLAGASVLVAVELAWQSVQMPADSLVGSPLFGTLGTVLFGLAAALFTMRTRWSRPAAFAGLAIAATCAAVSVDRKAWSLRHALAETTARATQESEMDLGSVAQGLRVSPTGSHFLAARSLARRRTSGVGLMLGRFGGDVRELPAIGGDFVDSARILVMDALEGGLEVRLEHIDSIGAPIWTDTLPDIELIEPRVTIDRDAGSWSIAGGDADTDHTVLFAGMINQKGRRRVALSDTIAMIGQPIVFGQAATVLVPTYPRRLRNRAAVLSPLSMFSADMMRTELWRVSSGGMTPVTSFRGYPQCGEPSGGIVACAVRHIRATSLYTLDSTGRAIEVAQLPMQDLGVVVLGPGALAASMNFDRTIVGIDLTTRRLTRFELPPNSEFASEVRVGPGFIATLSYGENRRSKVRKYRIEGSR